MKATVHSESAVNLAKYGAEKNSAAAISRVRMLVWDLVNEVESLAQLSLSVPETSLPENLDSVDFYEAVTRFEITLIKDALRCTNGNQTQAARLLNMNFSTLNAKIKHHHIVPRIVPLPCVPDTTPAVSATLQESSS